MFLNILVFGFQTKLLLKGCWMYKIFQVALEEADTDIISDFGWFDACVYSVKIRAYVESTIKHQFSVAFSLGQHKHVASIQCDSLQQVFDIGNMGPEEKITRYAPMHSVSVGDVIQTPEGEFFAVASFGFEKVEA